MEIPLSGGQTMMRPKVEGRMLQAVAIRPDETVLEIGTGSGFISACLCHLARSVSSVEISEQLHAEASARLRDKRLNNIELHVGDALSGWQPEQAYDVLLVTGSVPDVPDVFRNWVNTGGRMFIVTGESPAMEAKLLARISASDWTEQSLFETDLIRLINADQPPQFEF
jgi:protein-L-isoaspartate(D-aspartate) O-methyltransferase